MTILLFSKHHRVIHLFLGIEVTVNDLNTSPSTLLTWASYSAGVTNSYCWLFSWVVIHHSFQKIVNVVKLRVTSPNFFFLQPIVKNQKSHHVLSERKKKSSKSWHLKSWNLFKTRLKQLLYYQNSQLISFQSTNPLFTVAKVCWYCGTLLQCVFSTFIVGWGRFYYVIQLNRHLSVEL